MLQWSCCCVRSSLFASQIDIFRISLLFLLSAAARLSWSQWFEGHHSPRTLTWDQSFLEIFCLSRSVAGGGLRADHDGGFEVVRLLFPAGHQVLVVVHTGGAGGGGGGARGDGRQACGSSGLGDITGGEFQDLAVAHPSFDLLLVVVSDDLHHS